MANAESGFSLTSTFKEAADMVWSFFKHVFSPHMIAMMAIMALPAVSMAAPVGGATLGDWGGAILDHYITMFTAPFSEAGTVSDMVGNTVNGELAMNSYEMGAGHSAHMASGHETLSYSDAGQIQADKAADLWGMDPDEHSRLMQAHP